MTKNIKTLIRCAAGVFCLGGMMLSAGLFTSCTEKDNTVEEFADWQSKNETYWNKLYTATQQKIKSGDTSWKIILNYSYQNQKQTSGSALTYSPEDYIIAHVEVSLVDGFTTALMSMHRGDHWTVYIPHQLGYGTSASGTVPAYSTLIFDLRLVDFSHPGTKLKDS